MFCNAKELTLKFENIEMDYITFGNGRKSLVIIQGLSTRSIRGMAVPLAFLYQIFAKDYTIYLFDRRKVVEEGITVRNFAADIARAMDALRITNADVFGVSQGGMIAQYLAIDRPDLVHKLVLAVTLSRNNDTVKSVIADWIKMTEEGKFKALVADMAVKMYSDAYIKRYEVFMPLLTVFQKPKDVNRFITLAKTCLTCNTYEELDKIQCPVLVMGGKEDKIVTGEASEEIAGKLGCQIYMYEKMGHAIYEEARDFNKRVYDFLKE